jgi:two-component system, LytTR family, response regulator
MIKAILIDDEIHCLDSLSMLIAEYCPDIEVIDQCPSAKKGLLAIEKTKPDIVFLDIEMPIMNGFELLEHFQESAFAVIFTTSYDQYAIKAIRFSALDYLLKPIDPKELVSAVKKITAQKSYFTKEQFNILIDQVKNKPSGFLKIALPTAQGFELILADQILKCEADDNYTHIHCKNKTRITACRSLKEIEEQLSVFEFFIRVHHSYLVNLNEIHRYVRGEGGYLIMSDTSIVDVSRSRKDLLLKKLQPNRF